jgi:hypothetical protein
METLTLTPAHGRDYRSKAAVQQAWTDGQDFIIQNFGHRYEGKPIGKSSADEEGITVHIRYRQLTRIAVINPELKK